MKAKIVSAKVDGQTAQDIDALALAWSERLGREVSRSEVVRTLLVRGVEGHPVTDDLRERVQAGERYRAPARPSAPRLRIVDLHEEDTTSPRGIDLTSCTLGTAADITRLRRAA